MSSVTQHNQQVYLLAFEAAALLRCHPRTVSRMIASGPPFRMITRLTSVNLRTTA
jgi:hypothetical protein